jgi:hypothetical protein
VVTTARRNQPRRQSRKGKDTSIRWRYAVAVVTAGLCVWGGLTFARNQINDASIASHGRDIRASVVNTGTGGDESLSTYWLYVWIPACHCQVPLQTDNPKAHPIGAFVPVVYDTTNPTSARLLIDGPSTLLGWALDALFFALGAFGVFLIYMMVRDEIRMVKGRRTRARVASSAGSRP